MQVVAKQRGKITVPLFAFLSLGIYIPSLTLAKVRKKQQKFSFFNIFFEELNTISGPWAKPFYGSSVGGGDYANTNYHKLPTNYMRINLAKQRHTSFIRPWQGRVVWCTLYVGVPPYAILCRTCGALADGNDVRCRCCVGFIHVIHGALPIGNDMWWHGDATNRNTQ